MVGHALYIVELLAERDALRRKLDAIAAIPEPEPPCPCKPRRWKDCECGAYRKGGFHTNEIDAYAEAMEVWDAVRAIVEAEHGRD